MNNLFTSSMLQNEILQCKDFNEALDMYLQKNNYTMSDLAELMGYSQKNLYSVAHHRTEMTLKFAKKLANATKINCLFWIELYLDKYHTY